MNAASQIMAKWLCLQVSMAPEIADIRIGHLLEDLKSAGYAVVPLKATQAMVDAYWNSDWGVASDPSTPDAESVWEAMIEAAP